MTARERAVLALEQIRADHWTADAVVRVVEQQITAAIHAERRRCARIVGRYPDPGARAAYREIRAGLEVAP